MYTQTPFVYQGVWRDYDRPAWNSKLCIDASDSLTFPGYQWTLKESVATAMTNLIAVALALGLSRMFVFVRFIVAAIRKRKSASTSTLHQAEIPEGTNIENANESGMNLIPIPPAFARRETACVTASQPHHQSLMAFDTIEEGLANASSVIFRRRIEVGVKNKGMVRRVIN